MRPLWAKGNTPEVNARKGSPGSSNPKWRPVGSISVSWHGYAKIKLADNDWRYVHRLIVGEPAGMDVHHIDGNSMNNDPANLLPMNPVEHRSYHRALKK